jgi:hypothetical protein
VSAASSTIPWFEKSRPFLRWVSIFSAALAGVCLIYLFFFGEAAHHADEIAIVSGRVSDARIVHHSESADSLDLWLDSHPLPYRWNVGMPQSRINSPLAAVRGAVVQIGTRAGETPKVSRDYSRREDFIPVYSLVADGTVLFSLDDYNRWTAHNQNIGKMLCSSVFLASVAMFIYVRSPRTNSIYPGDGANSEGFREQAGGPPDDKYEGKIKK